ncbi:MAG TPA: T9SS type A sorting domain-containing protein [Saprospiraceae bacterium]|nr:T9SS type A sorting domain-containing protein [Saprospiraceae bacterium]
MKKFYFFCLFFTVLSTNLMSQITVTSTANTPQIGDSFTYYRMLSPTFDVRNNGANQTWDFSSLTGALDTFSYIDVANSTDPNSFPNATMVAKLGNNGENYYEATATELSYWGGITFNQRRTDMTDKREVMVFPITYNDVFNNTYAAVVTANGLALNLTGTSQIKATGFGDLITPYGTVHNVLKIETVSNYSYTGVPGNYSDTISLWYNAYTRTFIASTSYGYANGNLSISKALCITQADLVTSNTEPVIAGKPISVFPNPTNDFIQLDDIDNEPVLLKIFDINGRLVLKEKVLHHKVDVSQLNNGIYIMKYIQDQQLHTGKLVIE